VFWGGAMKPQISIAQLLVVMVPLAIGLTAIANPTPFWEICIFGFALFVLFTAVLGAIYRTGGTRAFWLGFALFGWGFLLLCAGLPFDHNPLNRAPNPYQFFNYSDPDDPPLRSFTKAVVEVLQLDRRTGPRSVGEKVQVQWGGANTYYPSSVLEIKNNMFRIRYDSDPQGAFDEWVGANRLRLVGLDRVYRIAESLFALFFALAGGLIARYLYSTRDRRKAESRSPRAEHAAVTQTAE
jgi:hypothetical protein